MMQGNGKSTVVINPPTEGSTGTDQEVVVEVVREVAPVVLGKPLLEFPDRPCQIGDMVYFWNESPSDKEKLICFPAMLVAEPYHVYEYESAGKDETTGKQVWVKTDKIIEHGRWTVSWFFIGKWIPAVQTPYSSTPRKGCWTFRDVKKD